MTLLLLRQQIDALDRSILQLIAKRLDIARRTRAHKRQVTDKEREQELSDIWADNAKTLGLPPDFAEEILKLIIAESKRAQA